MNRIKPSESLVLKEQHPFWFSLKALALFGALSLLPQQGVAQNTGGMNEGVLSTEVTAPKVDEKKGSAIDWATAIKGIAIKTGDEGASQGDEDEKEPGITRGDGDKEEKKIGTSKGDVVGEKNSRIAVHGIAQVGKIVIPDYADIASENVAILLCVDASDMETGLGMSVIRIDDFDKSPDNPISKATVINPHRDKKVGKKAFVSVNSEIAFIDKLPEGNGVTAKVLGSYDVGKGRNFEGTYFHGFNKGPDSDSFRLGITKKINEALSLTAQGWYKSDYNKKYFGHVIINVNLGNGFWAQMGCIAKGGKLDRTVGAVLKI